MIERKTKKQKKKTPERKKTEVILLILFFFFRKVWHYQRRNRLLSTIRMCAVYFFVVLLLFHISHLDSDSKWCLELRGKIKEKRRKKTKETISRYHNSLNITRKEKEKDKRKNPKRKGEQQIHIVWKRISIDIFTDGGIGTFHCVFVNKSNDNDQKLMRKSYRMWCYNEQRTTKTTAKSEK